MDGRYGTELRARVRTQDGVDDMRFVGVDGPRWMVRAVYQGPAAVDPALAGPLDECLAGLGVDRGTQAMPVKDPLPLRLPRELAVAAGLVWPVTAVRHRADLAGLGARGLARSAVAGLALAVHFGTWMSALALTSVATATALVCTQPAWAGLLAALRGRPLPRLVWLGLALAVAIVALQGLWLLPVLGAIMVFSVDS